MFSKQIALLRLDEKLLTIPNYFFQAVQNLEGIPINQQRILHEGVQLPSDHSTARMKRITEYKIRKESTVYLLARLRGGGIIPI